jgi:hypothetical protein
MFRGPAGVSCVISPESQRSKSSKTASYAFSRECAPYVHRGPSSRPPKHITSRATHSRHSLVLATRRPEPHCANLRRTYSCRGTTGNAYMSNSFVADYRVSRRKHCIFGLGLTPSAPPPSHRRRSGECANVLDRRPGSPRRLSSLPAMANWSAYVPLRDGSRGALRNANCAVMMIPARFNGPLRLNSPTPVETAGRRGR